jgi:hypothetical protein
VDEERTRALEQKLAEYKQMVIMRQDECSQIGKVFEEKARKLSVTGGRIRNLLIVLGVLVAAKEGLELAMLKVPKGLHVAMTAVTILFLVIGLAIAMIAELAKANRYEEKAGELRELSSLCKSHERRFMSDYKKFVDTNSPDITLARLELRIDLQNETLDNIHQRSDSLGVDLIVDVSYRI